MMKLSFNQIDRTALDVVNVVAGIGLAVSPWLAGYAGEAYAAWNAWIVGAAVALLAIGALTMFHQAEEWANLALGLWAIASPWLLGFSAVSGAVAFHVILGVIVAAFAAGGLWLAGNRPYSTA
jgi:hypothetical protein